jgi:hypothetical protein
MSSTSNLPTNIEATAFRCHTEYAWQKKDLKPVFEFCIEAAIAIAGGEVWIVKQAKDCQPDEPTEFIHNLDSERNQKVVLLARTLNQVIYGTFPLRDGRSGVFVWSCEPRKSNQSWQEYAQETVMETAEIIEKGNLETDVIPDYSSSIYYNLIFEREDGTSF